MFSRNDFSIWSILRKCIGMVSAGSLVLPEEESLGWGAGGKRGAGGRTHSRAMELPRLEGQGWQASCRSVAVALL